MNGVRVAMSATTTDSNGRGGCGGCRSVPPRGVGHGMKADDVVATEIGRYCIHRNGSQRAGMQPESHPGDCGKCHWYCRMRQMRE